MSNPDENEPPDAPPVRTRASRLFRLVAAGLAGGIVTCLIAGLRGLRSEYAIFYGIFMVVAGALLAMPFAFPLGFAAGLYIADKRLGMRGPLWPAVAASYAGILLAVGVYLLYLLFDPQYLQTPGSAVARFVRSGYGGGLGFLLSIAGGLFGHLRSRRRDSVTQ